MENRVLNMLQELRMLTFGIATFQLLPKLLELVILVVMMLMSIQKTLQEAMVNSRPHLQLRLV